MACFRTASEVWIRSLIFEKTRLFYMETYLLRKHVSDFELGLDTGLF